MARVGENQQFNKEFFKRILAKNALGHAYLFEGPTGSGKKDLAVWLAQSVLCQAPIEDGQACQACNACLRVKENNHPDVIHLQAESASIKVDQVRELLDRLSKTGVEALGQVVIIEEAEKMTTGAANSLLKLLEEPEKNTLLILLTTAKNRLLPTIISRCQVISFKPISQEACHQALKDVLIPDPSAQVLSYMTQDVGQAQAWFEDSDFQEILTKMMTFYDYLVEKNDLAIPYIQSDLVPLLSSREDQELSLEMLTSLFRIDLRAISQVETDGPLNNHDIYQRAEILSIVLQASQMFQAHVPFQSVMEYIGLKVLTEAKG